MKKLLLLLALLPINLIAQELLEIPFVDGKVQFETVLEIKDKTAKELYADVTLLISDIYKSGKAVTDVADDEALFIVVKGITYYPLKDWLGTVQEKLEHTIKFQFKDERIKITFTNLVVYSIPFECIAAECKGYKFSPNIRKEHTKQVFLIWDDLQKTIIGKLANTDNDNW